MDIRVYIYIYIHTQCHVSCGWPILVPNPCQLGGGCGDCWLIAAIAAVAEFPSFIKDHLFSGKELSQEGAADLRVSFLVETNLPHPLFGRANVILLEGTLYPFPCGRWSTDVRPFRHKTP